MCSTSNPGSGQSVKLDRPNRGQARKRSVRFSRPAEGLSQRVAGHIGLEDERTLSKCHWANICAQSDRRSACDPWEHRSRWGRGGPVCSGCCRSIRTGELTLTATKPTFTSAAGATMNVSEPRDSGQSHWASAGRRRERPVSAIAADSCRPKPEGQASPKLPATRAAHLRDLRLRSSRSWPPGPCQ